MRRLIKGLPPELGLYEYSTLAELDDPPSLLEWLGSPEAVRKELARGIKIIPEKSASGWYCGWRLENDLDRKYAHVREEDYITKDEIKRNLLNNKVHKRRTKPGILR